MAQLVFFFLPMGTTINSFRYCKMVKNRLKIHMTIHECNMFMQDSVPYHCSKLVSYFLKKKVSKCWIGLVITQIFMQLRICRQYLEKKWQMNISQVLKIWKWQLNAYGHKLLQLNTANA